MSEQLNIHGQPDQPRTWDGEPLYSPSTVAEGLFDPEAFEQMPGQLAMEEVDHRPDCPRFGWDSGYCRECGAWFGSES